MAFDIEKIKNFLPFELSDKKIKEIQNLEDWNYTLKSRYPDLTGKNYHHLWVLGKGPNGETSGGNKFCRWWCICDCPDHNIILVRSNNLSSGNTKSCGCQNIEASCKNIKKALEIWKVDLTNQQFGELTAIRPTDKRSGNSVIWECLCSCGRIHYVASNMLNAHRIESCGHNKDSKGVRRIKHILNDNNISYQTEKTYGDLKTSVGGTLRFDFWINNEFLLEYDGEQHYLEKDLTYFRDSLEQRQTNDQLKNEYCKTHNIPLKRIPYTELDNITLENIMGNKYSI